MLKGPDEDPGGSSSEHPSSDTASSENVSELKDQYDQSELLLAQLKEVLKKSEQTTLTPEKFELYANTLSRAKRNKLKRDADNSKSTGSHKTIDSPATERVSLLRQQLEENKAKLAERGKSQKGIEEMVIQLKAQLDDSQQLISQTPLNLSLIENKIDYSKNSSSEELYNILLNKERYITDLSAKVHKLETTVLDLQENLKEKDSVIDARTKAITLMTESLTKKSKTTLDALDDTKEQMRKMQENFVAMEADMKARQLKLLDDLKVKNIEIANSQEIISNLKEEYEQKLHSSESTQGSSLEIEDLKLKIKQLEELNSELSESIKTSPKKSSKRVKRAHKFTVQETDFDETKVCELQEALDLETSRNEELVRKVANLEGRIIELNDCIIDVRAKYEPSEHSIEHNEEIRILKKQLDDQNKSNIKFKAQHKSKMRELNKKIEAFKNISDANAEIVKLDAENSKLNHKIAELEEEKGNLQLKLMETDSSKDSASPELIEELNRDLSEKIHELLLKEDTIIRLESDIQSSKAEIESLTRKLNTLSHLQQDQVTTEMTSIQYEEQLDKLENEKKALLDEKENISKEYEEKLDALQKEKQELMTKLESYEQENMELIEKLEKLSTEKVSSAESIEIVEALTQQEKLELEQYQKNMDIVTGNLKVSDECLLPSPDLNESVNQLTEETSELLQKIELFTVERREVMEKMEVLTSENNNLSLKIKEIENNRDILVETYEQLQNEKECLDSRIDDLEKENSELKRRLESSESNSESERKEELTEDVSNKLLTLERQYNELLEENKRLETELKQSSELIHEKDAIESDLREARQTILDMEAKIKSNLEEINNYQTLIEDNKNELINSAETINKLQNKLEQTENQLQAHKNEVAHLNSVIADLNNAVMSLESENKSNMQNTSSVESQLAELKAALNDQIQQAEEYEKEIGHNSEIINDLNKELKTLNNKIIETEHLLDSKDDEIKKLLKERDNKEMVITGLQYSIKEKDEAFHKLKDDLKEKYLNMQKQMEANSGTLEDIKVPLQNTIDELTKKNKEQLEKMKKIAANLKKKNQAYQELEQKFKAQKEEMEKRIQEYTDLEKKFTEQSVYVQSSAKEKDEKQRSSVEEEIQQINFQKAELNAIISELTDTESLMSESLKDEMSFHGSDIPFPSELDVNYLTAKIQEVKRIRHRQQNKIVQYEEHIAQLEDTVASAEQTQIDLHRQISELNAQLEEKNNKLTEVAEAENALLEKLTHLTNQYENNERALIELGQEKEKLIAENNHLKEQKQKLKQKVNVAQEKVHELSSYAEHIAQKDLEIDALYKDVAHSESEIKHLQSELERLSKDHQKEFETIDADWQQQSSDWHKEKTELTMQVEKLNEQFTELMEKNASFRDEISEYKSKLQEIQKHFDELKNENQENINTIHNMNAQISTLQEENENLKINLNVISNQMVTYQQQNNQLQAENTSLVNQLMNASSNQNNEMAILYNELNRQLEEITNERQQLVNELQEVNSYLRQTQDEGELAKKKLTDYEEEINTLKSKIEVLKDNTLKEVVSKTVDDVLNHAQEAMSVISVASNQGTKSTQIQGQKSVLSRTEEAKITTEDTSEIPTFSWTQVPISEVSQHQKEESIQLFAKPFFEAPDSSDPFAFVTQTVSSDSAIHITPPVQQMPQDINMPTYYNQEKLLSRINSLEVMLANAEKQNNEVLNQCTELSNEVTKLTYNENKNIHESLSESTYDELISKINSLEVMLASAEKEKNDAVIHCNELSNEVTRLIQEKQNLAQSTFTEPEYNQEELLSRVNSLEVMLANAHKEKNEVINHYTELSNEIARLKHERLPQLNVFDVFDAASVQRDVPQSIGLDLEGQIVSDLEIQHAKEARKELCDIEFEATKPCLGPCQDVVTEEPLHMESTYLCYKKDEKDAPPVAVDPFAEDDGWGFGPEEAKIEAKHVQKLEGVSEASTALVEQLQEKIRVLELERQNHLEEMKQQQIKSGKLIKKLKELKQRNEQLSSKTKKSDDFFSLDDAIQEELKSQIEQLEKKIKELGTELKKEKAEKASIAKRVDVLTAANERMVEMKEKQDVELLCWQRKNQELSEKLQQFEWSGDGFGVPEHRQETELEFNVKPTEGDIHELQKRIEDLNKIVNELTLDKEELQALLDEQTALRVEVEKTRTMPQTDYLELIIEKNDLSENYKMTLEEKKQLQEAYNALLKDSENHQRMLHSIEEANSKLSQLISEKDSLIEEIESKLQALGIENEQLILSMQNANIQQQLNSVLQEKETTAKELDDTKQELHMILQEKNGIIHQLQEKESMIKDLEDTRQELHNVLQEKGEVILQLQDKHATLDDLQKQFEDLKDENNRLRNAVEDSSIQEEYRTRLEMITEEKDALVKQIQEKEIEIQESKEFLNTQITSLKTELDKQIKTTEELLEQNKLLSESLGQKNREYEQLSQELISKDAEISLMIEHLTHEWESRVDQRGTDVAESWKLHLETRESEFSQMEQLLRREINELEEKCNTLVNENNELRKNVDTEIKNEVDHVTALQKQINDLQHTISELSQSLQQKQEEIERLQYEISNYEIQVEQLNQVLKKKEDAIIKHVTDEEAIQLEFTENQEIIKKIVLKLQQKSPFVSSQKDHILEELDRLITESSKTEAEVQNLHEKLTETISSDELLKKEDELRNVTLILEQHKTKYEELEEKYRSLENDIETKSMEINSLNANLLEAQNTKKLESEKANILEQSLLEYQQQYSSLNYELQEKMSSLEQLTSEWQSCSNILQQRDEEIKNLKSMLEEKEQLIISITDNMNAQNNTIINDYTQEINNMKKRLFENEMHYEDLLSSKEHDIESLKVQLDELTHIVQDYEHLETSSASKDTIIEELNQKINEQNVLLDDEHKQLTELRAIIEEQVLKIEELKEQLFAKSNDYDSLIAQMETIMMPTTRQPTTSAQSSQQEQRGSSSQQQEDDLTEPVRRAEHDLALYVLHQTDVRCEELTAELSQLLDERDTLQLRLSNAIREKEELRRRYQVDTCVSEDETAEAKSSGSPKSLGHKSKTTAIVLGATGTEMATEATEHLPEESSTVLANKLSELKTVSNRKDKTIVDEQELRRMQQFSIMQQHRDVASRLPPEAAARLVDATYTLSRDVQSPSKVLLSWLWGRSTPKVNNI